MNKSSLNEKNVESNRTYWGLLLAFFGVTYIFWRQYRQWSSSNDKPNSINDKPNSINSINGTPNSIIEEL